MSQSRNGLVQQHGKLRAQIFAETGDGRRRSQFPFPLIRQSSCDKPHLLVSWFLRCPLHSGCTGFVPSCGASRREDEQGPGFLGSEMNRIRGTR